MQLYVFLTKLVFNNNVDNKMLFLLNIRRMANKWKWHNYSYTFGYEKDASKNANIDIYNPDVNHGILSIIMYFIKVI